MSFCKLAKADRDARSVSLSARSFPDHNSLLPLRLLDGDNASRYEPIHVSGLQVMECSFPPHRISNSGRELSDT